MPPTPKRPTPLRLLALLASLALAAVALTACGGGGGGNGGADPAAVVPSTAPVYLEATLRPEGSRRDDAQAALRKLLHTEDPAKRLRELLDRNSSSLGLKWDDVRPWLGQRVGIFLTSVSGSKASGAVVAASTDDGKARDALSKAIRSPDKGKPAPKVSTRSYRGVDYFYDSVGDNAAGIVDGYAVGGDLAGFKGVVDTAKGGRALDANPDLRSARSAVTADKALGFAWADPQSLLDAVSHSTSLGSGAAALRQLAAQAGRAIAASLHANGSAVAIDAAALGAPGSSGSAAADAVAALPGDAWLAIGLGDVGGALRKALAQVSQIGGLAGVDVSGALRRLRAKTGLDVQRDLLSWMGDGAIYARGRSIADLGGVLTVRSTDASASRAAVGRLSRLLRRLGATVRSADVTGYDRAIEIRYPGLPVSMFLAASGERVSFGLNPQALADVAKPGSKLGDSAGYRTAAGALGKGLRPVMLVDTQTVLALLQSLGVGLDQRFAKAKPYLDAIGVITAGTGASGDARRARLAVALR